LANRAGGYSYAYDDPGRDITGRHDLELDNTVGWIICYER
jgi:hypothetical protein